MAHPRGYGCHPKVSIRLCCQERPISVARNEKGGETRTCAENRIRPHTNAQAGSLVSYTPPKDGGVAEWFKAAVLKTVTRHQPRAWFMSASPLTPSEPLAMEVFPFGQKGTREDRRGRSGGHNPVTGALIQSWLPSKPDRGIDVAPYGRMRAIARYPSGMPASPEARMKLKSLTLLLSLLLLLRSVVSASSIIPQPWQPIVNNADLVGVIECVTAGEIVARYRVVESWKGPKEGTVLTVRGAASVYEPSLPIVLYGERLVVAAWKYRSEYRLATGLYLSMGPGGSLPPFWRDDHPDYFIPSILHFCELSPDPRRGQGEGGMRMFGGYTGDLDSFRRDVKALLALPDEAREAAVLRTLIDWHIKDDRGGSTFVPDSAQVTELVARANTTRVDSIVTALDNFVERGRPGSSTAAYHVLYTGGGVHTLDRLTTVRNKHGEWSGSTLPSLIHGIRRRLGLDPLEDYNPIAMPPRPTDAALDSMRTLLRSPAQPGPAQKDYRINRDTRQAFETLSVHDPEFVATYLTKWIPGPDTRYDGEGYGLGSFFGWRCGRSRAAYMRRLLQAKDPYIRVAAAIYLSFENESEGVRTLRSFMELPGDPGAWAALNLARRGDKEAAYRALDSFLRLPDPTVYDRLHRNLQKRLLVLFSNSAAVSGVPQPERWRYVQDQDEEVRVYEDLVEWWNTNSTKLVLSDPWFDEWRQQKIE